MTILQKYGHILSWKTGTTHGSPYDYDRRIPLYFMGKPFVKGPKQGVSSSEDIVPTILNLVGLQPKGLDGKVLEAARK